MQTSKKLTTPLLCAMMLVLSACAHGSMPVTGTSEYCRIAKPIRYNSKKDSPETVVAIEAHNSAWVCVCEDDCPK